MTDIIGVMCTPLGRFPFARWRGEVVGTAAVPRILLYDDFRFSHSRFACAQSSVRVCLALYIRAFLSRVTHACDFVKTPKPYMYVCVCAFIRERPRMKVRETWRPKERRRLRRGSEGELRISHYIYKV